MCNPPVNALDVAGWHELARRSCARSGTTAPCASSILRRRGKGSTPASTSRRCSAPRGHEALLGANRGCYAAFAAVYECEVPVIAAVHGYCLGGASGSSATRTSSWRRRDATFGLPEVDRGALGAATHLARLVPQHKMRAMVYTAATRDGRRAACVRLGARGRRTRRAARRRARVAARIAAKSPHGHPRRQAVAQRHRPGGRRSRSYRFEQGFTFELNLRGVGDEARAAFVDKRETKPTR